MQQVFCWGKDTRVKQPEVRLFLGSSYTIRQQAVTLERINFPTRLSHEELQFESKKVDLEKTARNQFRCCLCTLSNLDTLFKKQPNLALSLKDYVSLNSECF